MAEKSNNSISVKARRALIRLSISNPADFRHALWISASLSATPLIIQLLYNKSEGLKRPLKNNKMKGSVVIEHILEILQIQAESSVDLFDILTSDYGSSCRKLRRSLRYGPRNFKTDWAADFHDYQRFLKVISHLKSQGLVEKTKKPRGSPWKITARGKIKLQKVREINLYSTSGKNYDSSPDSVLKVIAYDIPARENRKRTWLRSVLKNLDFKMLQRSVWIGKRKIPEALIKDLRQRNMSDYVQIWGVDKGGTLSQIS